MLFYAWHWLVLQLVIAIVSSQRGDTIIVNTQSENFSSETLGPKVEACVNDGQFQCRITGEWNSHTEYQELLSIRLKLLSLEQNISSLSYQQINQRLENVISRVASLETSINTQSIDVSTKEIYDIQKTLAVLDGLVAGLDPDSSSYEVLGLKDELAKLTVNVEGLLSHNPFGSRDEIKEELNSLKTRLADCTDGFSGIGSYFSSDKEELTDALDKEWCETHQLESVNDPFTHRYVSSATYGEWIKDPLPNSPDKLAQIFLLNSQYREFYSYNNYSDFVADKNSVRLNVIRSQYPQYSSVIYNGSFYFFYGGSIYRDNNGIRTSVKADYTSVHYHGYPSSAGVDLAVDEYGLWAISAPKDAAKNKMIQIQKLNPETLEVERTFMTTKIKSTVCLTFMVCGRFYALETCNVRVHPTSEHLMYTFDTQTGETSFVPLFVPAKYDHLTSLSYNPREKMLFGFDKGHFVTYTINWKE